MKYIFGFIAVVGVILSICPTIYWTQHPELTQMQVAIETWPFIISGITMLFIGVFGGTK